MLTKHVWGLFVHPTEEWAAIRDADTSVARALFYSMILGAIPVVSGFIGTTQVGWQVGSSETIQLTMRSASLISVIYYGVIIAAVFSVGWMIHWMAETYGARQTLARCIVLAVFIPTPMFLVGVMQMLPILWLNLVIGLPALAYTVFLLYTGIPVVMEIPAERGFLFASAVLAVGLVGLVGLLAVTAILWGIGIGPTYTS